MGDTLIYKLISLIKLLWMDPHKLYAREFIKPNNYESAQHQTIYHTIAKIFYIMFIYQIPLNYGILSKYNK